MTKAEETFITVVEPLMRNGKWFTAQHLQDLMSVGERQRVGDLSPFMSRVFLESKRIERKLAKTIQWNKPTDMRGTVWAYRLKHEFTTEAELQRVGEANRIANLKQAVVRQETLFDLEELKRMGDRK